MDCCDPRGPCGTASNPVLSQGDDCAYGIYLVEHGTWNDVRSSIREATIVDDYRRDMWVVYRDGTRAISTCWNMQRPQRGGEGAGVRRGGVGRSSMSSVSSFNCITAGRMVSRHGMSAVGDWMGKWSSESCVVQVSTALCAG